MQQRIGADRLVVILIDVDAEYFGKPDQYLPQAEKILRRHKVTWPNALAPRGLHDVVRAFNLSGYGNIVVDAGGIVRGVNVDGQELERLVEKIVATPKVDKPGK